MLTPSRLTLARTRRGLTAAELARKSGASARAIGEYERGQRRPKPATAEALAAALSFPAAFLAAPDPARPQGVTLRTAERAQATAVAQLAIEFSGWMDRMFVLPQPDLPAPRTSAEDVRAAWRMGSAPAPNMVQLLESHGIRVFSLPVDCAAVDVFSCWHNGTPFVFLDPTATPERARFDAAAELGAVLGHDQPERFAADFLMPRQHLRGTDHGYWYVDRETFAAHANVGSIGAAPGMARRETSKLLAKVFKTLRENGTTPHHVARELALGPEDLYSLVFGLVLTALPGGGEPGPVRRGRLTLVH